MKKIFNLIVLLGVYGASIFAQSTHTDSIASADSLDVEQWLLQYSSSEILHEDSVSVTVVARDTTTIQQPASQPIAKAPESSTNTTVSESPTIETIVPVKSAPRIAKPVKPAVKSRNPRVEGKTPKIPLLVSDFISDADSLAIVRQAQIHVKYNPIFMDEWVVTTADGIDSLSLNADDLTRAIRKKAQAYVLKNNTELFTYHETQLPNIEEIKGRRDSPTVNNGINVADVQAVKIDKIRTINPELSPWKYGGDVQIQISQNYISDNWYTGGESNLAAYFFFKGNFNYNNNKNLQWDNQIDAKFNFNTATSDTIRFFRTNDDLLKLTSKLGIRAFSSKNFYYTTEVEFSTPLFNTYITNSYERVAGPFSPIRLFTSVGLDYKYKKLSVLVLPVSYRMIYVSDTTRHEGVTVSIADKVGLDAGKNIKNEIGSKIKIQWKHNFSKEIAMETNFSLYTNYTGVEVDWEIIGNFIINRFLSARVSLNPRYDSTITLPDGEKPKIQFKELISLGFRYKF